MPTSFATQLDNKISLNREYPRLAIVVPAFNEAKVISKVISDLLKNAPQNSEIIVVNDGSEDFTLRELEKFSGQITIFSHLINCGLGAAIATGFSYAKENDFNYMITIDADGQHRVKDLKKVFTALLENKTDVVIGSRLINSKGMPWYRKLGNWGLNAFTYFFFGVWTTDSQSGLRGFNKNAINKIKLEMTRMEVSSEIIGQIKTNNLRFIEVPIKAIYTDYSLEKGQSNANGIKILLKIFLHKLLK